MRYSWRIAVTMWLVAPWSGCAAEVGTPDDASPQIVATGAALISPEGDLHDFPPWMWPYIRPAAIWNAALSGELSIDRARAAMKAAVEDCGCALGSNGADVDVVLAALATTFDTQYAASRLAVAGGDKQAGGSFGSFVDDDWCGTGHPKFPWPRPRGLYELLTLERELFGAVIERSVKLDDRELRAVHAALDEQLGRFKALGL